MIGNISNTGHALQVTLTVQNNTIQGGPLGTDVYELLQFHWHAPSEHTLNGVQPVAELHAVHINTNNHSELVCTPPITSVSS
jgi:carbonic anhydrase